MSENSHELYPLRRPILVWLVLFFTVSHLFSQNLRSISGVVTDKTGSAAPNATVKLTNTDTGLTRTFATNEAGNYVAPAMPAGTYSLEVSASGFFPAIPKFYLGQIARAEQDTAGAAKYYRRSDSCDGDSPEAHLRLGMTLAEMNRNEDALRELKQAVRLAPDNRSAHYRLGLLYKRLGRADESAAEYQVVRRL